MLCISPLTGHFEGVPPPTGALTSALLPPFSPRKLVNLLDRNVIVRFGFGVDIIGRVRQTTIPAEKDGGASI